MPKWTPRAKYQTNGSSACKGIIIFNPSERHVRAGLMLNISWQFLLLAAVYPLNSRDAWPTNTTLISIRGIKYNIHGRPSYESNIELQLFVLQSLLQRYELSLSQPIKSPDFSDCISKISKIIIIINIILQMISFEDRVQQCLCKRTIKCRTFLKCCIYDLQT